MSSAGLLDDLRNEVKRDRIVVVAGTGVSIAACGDQEVDGHHVARWDGLLLHGVDYGLREEVLNAKSARLLRSQIRSADPAFFISAAEYISQSLQGKNPGTYRRWLKESVGTLEPRNPAILHAISWLAKVVATLNYDGLFEAKTPRREAVTWMDPAKVQDVLRGDLPEAILHLHGHFDTPESVMLGLRSYERLANDAHASAVMKLLTLDRTILFVGCGDTLKDPNFARLLEWGRVALAEATHRHYLLCRKTDMKKLVATLNTVAPWIHILPYGTEHADLTPFLEGLAALRGTATPPAPVHRATTGGPPTPKAPDLAAYRQAVRTRYRRLKLEAMDPTTHDMRPLTLTGLFVPQDARECVEFLPRAFELPKEVQQRLREKGEWEEKELDERERERYRQAYIDQSPRPVLDVVADTSLARLVILGDPGSGKSTLLQYVLLTWADAPEDGRPVPILIELREYAKDRTLRHFDNFLDFLRNGGGAPSPFAEVDLDAWLQSTPTLVFFDGLDEVFDGELRREITEAIHLFAERYGQARIVVTSRVIGFQHAAWRDAKFRHFMLQELGKEQIADFLARWHSGAYADAREGEEKRQRLAEAITDSRAIGQLAGNPLLLTMMAILNRTQDLPRDRAELYEQCARLLLDQWKVDKAWVHDPVLKKASPDYRDKRDLMLGVARAMQSTPDALVGDGLAGNLIAEDLLEATLAEGLKGIPDIPPARAARALIEQLRGRNFMLCSVGPHTYAFVHRTFLEYFCAAAIQQDFEKARTLTIEQIKNDFFGRHWPDEHWHEVLCLLAGLLAPAFIAEILEYLLAVKDPQYSSRPVLLAALCVREVRKRRELGAVDQLVLERLRGLTDFEPPFPVSLAPLRETITVGTRVSMLFLVASIWHDDLSILPWLSSFIRKYDDVFFLKI